MNSSGTVVCVCVSRGGIWWLGRNVSVLVNTNFSACYFVITSIKREAWNFLKTFKNSQPHRQFVRHRFGFELGNNYTEQSFLRSYEALIKAKVPCILWNPRNSSWHLQESATCPNAEPEVSSSCLPSTSILIYIACQRNLVDSSASSYWICFMHVLFLIYVYSWLNMSADY